MPPPQPTGDPLTAETHNTMCILSKSRYIDILEDATQLLNFIHFRRNTMPTEVKLRLRFLGSTEIFLTKLAFQRLEQFLCMIFASLRGHVRRESERGGHGP